jgi:tape measure domain-containing protein
VADETHGIEIEIDSRPSEAGGDRVIRTLESIKKKTEQVGAAGAEAGKKTSDGLATAAAGGSKASRTMDFIREKARAAGNAGKMAGDAVKSAFDRMSSGADRANMNIGRIRPTLADLERNMDRVSRQRPFAAADESAKSFGGNLRNLKGLLIGLGLVEAGKQVISTAADYRGFNQSLRIIAGSQAGANKEMEYAAGVAQNLGLRVTDITKSYIGFSAASKGTAMAGQTQRDVFESLTKAGVAYGLSNDNIRGTLLAVQQIMSKGTVQSEELRGQLGERLPGAFQVAARAMGVTTMQLGKMLEAGQVLSDDFLPKFAAQLNKEIPNGAKSAYSGVNAFLTTLDKAKVALAESGFFDGVMNAFSSLAQVLTGFVQDGTMQAFGSAIGGTLTFLAQNIDLLKAAAVAYGVYFAAIKIGMVGNLVAEFIALERALGAANMAQAAFGAGAKLLQAGLGALLSPIGLVVIGVTGLVTVLMSMRSEGERTQAMLDGISKTTADASASLANANTMANGASIALTSVGDESATSETKVRNFAGAVGDAAQKLYDLAKARQVSMISELQQKRQAASMQYGEIYKKTAAGRRDRGRAALYNPIESVGDAFSKGGEFLSAAKDEIGAKLGFGPSEKELREGMGQVKGALKDYDAAIASANKNLEGFVTLQDKASVAVAKGGPPTKRIAAAQAQLAAADTEVKRATAGLALTRAQADSDLKAGNITLTEYRDRLADAMKAVNTARAATKGHTQALTEQKRALTEASRSAATRQTIGDRYDDQPRYLDQVDKDKRALDEMVGKWIEVGDAVVRYTQAMHDADVGKMTKAASKPFDDMIKEGQQGIVIQQKMLEGRRIEAQALQMKYSYEERYGQLLPGQYEQLVAIAAVQEKISREMEAQERLASIYIDAAHDIQSAFEKMLNTMTKNPLKAAGNFVKDVGKSFKTAMIKSLSNDIFGGIEREIQDFISGDSGFDSATEKLTNNTLDLAKVMAEATQIIKGAGGSVDGLGGVVSGIGGTSTATASGNKLTPTAGFGMVVEKIAGRTGTQLTKLWDKLPKSMQSSLSNIGGKIQGGLAKVGIKLPKSMADLSGTITKGLKGAGQGMVASSLVKSLGIKQSKTGAAIGGAAGSFLPIPGGAIIGGIVGGTIGGMMKSTKYGKVSLGSASGSVDASGNSSAAKKAATGAAKSVQDGLTSIAQTLGGMATGAFNVTLGTRHGDYRVTTGTSLKKAKGAKDFDDDEAGAIAYAIQLAVKQGAIQGITEASKRVLASNASDSTISAAATYEDLVRQAKKLANPVKGAFDEFKQGMDTTIAQLKAAGYSAEDLAAVQSVFSQQQKDALESMTSGYKDLITQMTMGPDSGKTVYQQFLDAQKKFDEVKADPKASQEDFTNAGQNLFGLSRQVYGTATPEFEAIKASLVKSTQDAIDHVSQVADMTGVVDAVKAAASTAEAQRDEQTALLRTIANSTTGGTVSGAQGSSSAQRQAY